jgi:hypothetical protein
MLYITWTNQHNGPTNHARFFCASVRTRAVRPSRRGPDRTDRAHERPSPRDSVIFFCCSVILQYRQPFCYNELNHFISLNSAILLQLTQPFYFTELSNFCYIAQSFCDFATMSSVNL